MRRRTARSRLLASLSAALVLTLAAPAVALEGGDGDGFYQSGFYRGTRIAWDLLIWRPLGFVRTGFSIAAFPVCYPVAAPFRAGDHCIDYLWRKPIYATFLRPLGE